MLLATQDGQNEYARHKRSGLLVPHFAGCYTTPSRSRPKRHRPDLFAPRYASMLCFCQPRALHLTASLREKPVQALVPPPHVHFGTSDQLGANAPARSSGNRFPAPRGQLCSSCPLPVAPQVCRGANPSLNNQTCSLRHTPAFCKFASLECRILLAALRAQPAHVSVRLRTFFLGASDQLGIMLQGRHTRIETG